MLYLLSADQQAMARFLADYPNNNLLLKVREKEEYKKYPLSILRVFDILGVENG